ncbi:MAG: restriction endonuclease subunit S [Candidatus Omnitrophota bacterium]|jgi:type I restriction enzyme S subunit
MKSEWLEKPFEDCIERVVYSKKIQKKKFLPSGEFPIISQEESFINGYWNNKSDVFRVKSPVVVFGDHTQVLKYVDFDFVLGADGVKILRPKAFLDPKYFFYYLKAINLKHLGYARHYKLLKKIRICYPEDLFEQKKIVSNLDKVNASIDQLEAVYEKKISCLKELKRSIIKSAVKKG